MRITMILLPGFVLIPRPGEAQAANKPGSWNGSIGVATAAMPTYPGSNKYRVRAVPILSLEYKERVYVGGSMAGAGAGAGVYLVRNSSLAWSTEINGAPERFERHGDGLAGMGRRGGAAFAASNVAYTLGSITAGAGVAVGLGGDEGSTGSVSLATRRRYGDRWLAELSTGATFANSENMSFDFGIRPEQAVRRQTLIDAGDSRLYPTDGRAYAPDGGLKQAHLSASLGYVLTARTTALAFASGSRLGGAALESPLVRQRNGLTAGVGVVYGF